MKRPSAAKFNTTNVLSGNKKKVQGPGTVHGKGKGTKGSSSVTVKAANPTLSADSDNRKRKNDLTQQDPDESDEHPPAKRGKAPPAAEQRARPAPRPLQKKRLEVAMDPVDRPNTKKRPASEATDMAHESEPITPILSKKAKTRTGLNEKPKKNTLRRTGTPIFFSAQINLSVIKNQKQ